MTRWEPEFRWETGKPDDFFVRVYQFDGAWSFQFYEWDGEFIEEGESGGFTSPEEAQQAAEAWYQAYLTPEPEEE